MRVIAGSAGGIPLVVPRTGLRPTMDVVKGAIFSSLGEMIVGARVLDLFAGTGALGIEALSRGAASATFVENDRRAVDAIRRNLEKTRLTGSVQSADTLRFLRHIAQPESFDLILADPPYSKSPEERDFTTELFACDALPAALAPDGIFVLEHLPGSTLPASPHWEPLRDKRYGATAVAFLRKIPSSGPGAESKP